MPTAEAYRELTVVPRAAVTLPVPLPVPDGFDSTRPETWPEVEGRLEYVGGRLLYMPPCGDRQQKTAIDLAAELALWQRQHPEFAVGGNEAGVLLGGETRAADGLVFRRADLGPDTGGLPRVPPILAVEIAGKDEEPEMLLDKAQWYLTHGVEVVWILVPATRTAMVVTPSGACDVSPAGRMPEHASLPGLEPRVCDLFRQLSAG